MKKIDGQVSSPRASRKVTVENFAMAAMAMATLTIAIVALVVIVRSFKQE
jgi:hypothetical protein